MTDKNLTLALLQFNPKIGDFAGNAAKIIDAYRQAVRDSADLLMTSEMALWGYPPEDLLQNPDAIAQAAAELEQICQATIGQPTAILLGSLWRENDRAYNAAIMIEQGHIKALRKKYLLPNYGVFDDKRYFCQGELAGPLRVAGVKLGVMICEDMWGDEVAECLAESGAQILLVMNGSPYERGKARQRDDHAVARVKETGLPLVYLNQLGGQDDLVFDGASFALSADAKRVLQLPAFAETYALSTWQLDAENILQPTRLAPLPPEPSDEELDYQAALVGLRDYVVKNNFPGVVLGLSGGIDSALVAVLAADALGAERVRAVMMPSCYNAATSLEDAMELAAKLGIRLDDVGITPAMTAFDQMVAPILAGDLAGDSEKLTGITAENIQSRARGMILMAVSNHTGFMVLTTGNKSEIATGYATLYGDMCGGYAPIKDMYKTRLYQLVAWRNAHIPSFSRHPIASPIPPRIITKAPSAELRDNQTDQDSLPPYDILDAILERMIEDEHSLAEIVAAGYDQAMVLKIQQLLRRSEYKRRQSAPGPKLTRRAFGRDRRYPMTVGKF
ncbi:MAG: NAD+ synthase [Candidatus Symbiobacter sp.]|nr:NAD+ synthase [Candidatus Symbiobacter sp.]